MDYKTGLPEINTIEFGKKMTRFRNKTGLSLVLLSKKTGISVNSLSKIETGETFPRMKNILKICNALDVSPDILTETGDSISGKHAIEEYLSILDMPSAMDSVETFMEMIKKDNSDEI